jgi:hypothetical protein
LQSILHAVPLGIAAALLLSAIWFVLFTLALSGIDEGWRWAVPVALLGAGIVAAITVGWLRTPNVEASALALDEQFALKERVTTLLTLPAGMVDTPAGQALLQDVGPRVEKLSVASRFPLTMGWKRASLPVAAMAIAVAAFFIDPLLGSLRTRVAAATPAAEQKVDAQEIQQQLEKLRHVADEKRNNPDAERSKELKELLDEWEKLVSKPDPTNAEQVRERIAEMRSLEQKMKERAQALKAEAQKNDTFKKLLEKLSEDGKKLKEGPAKDFEDALTKGDFHKAKETLDKLAKQMQENKLTPQQRQELQEQFNQLEEKVKRLAEKDEKRKQIEKDFQEGRINKEERDRQMKEEMKELQELANLLGQCKECLGEDAGNGEALAKLAKKFEEMELTDEELDEILRNMEALNEAALGIGQELGDENGLGEGGPPGGLRPIDPNDPDSKIINQRAQAKVNPTSQQRITGYTTGGNFNKIPANRVDGAFRQATQDAPGAIDRQNIPDDMADVARGYFKRLGGQK